MKSHAIFAFMLSCILLYGCSTNTNNKNIEKLDIDLNSLQYVGKYVLKVGINPNEPLILNHLTRYNGQQIEKQGNKYPEYQCFDVYMKHDHKDDRYQEPKPNSIVDCIFWSVDVECYILQNYKQGWITNEDGMDRGIIKTKGYILPAGALVYNPKEIKVYSRYSKELVMKISGKDLGYQQPYKNTALLDAVNMSSPHFGKNGKKWNIEGYYEYPLK